MRRRPAAALAALALASILAAAAPAAAQAPALTPAQEEAVRALVRDTLLRNPELLLEVLDALEEKKRAGAADERARALAERRAELERDPADPAHGAAADAADVTIVEFSDYRCPYCKRMAEPLAALLASDRRVRLVIKEIPILGPDSTVAARAALAAQRQGKHAAMHAALMARRGELDEAAVLAVARELGLDVERLKRDMGDPAISARIERNLALARALGVDGTPAFVVGDRFVPGAVDPETLRRLVAEARAARR
jgi:protein-disulfide isomerase